MFRRLVAPPEDLRELATVLRDRRIGAFDQVKVLENSPSQEVLREIENFFADRLHQDFLLLYFSGHGVKDVRGLFYFAASDTNPDRLVSTAVPASNIHMVVQNCRSRRKVLLIDSCFGGAIAKGLMIRSGGRVTPDELVGHASGLGILSATDALSYAYEKDTVDGSPQPSVFTKHLVHGLRSGEADLRQDGEVTFDELCEYVSEHVVRDSGQTPCRWMLDATGDMVIAMNADPSLVMLPDETQDLLDSPVLPTRLAGIEQLIKLARKRRMRAAVLNKLDQLQHDDSDRIKKVARDANAQIRRMYPAEQATVAIREPKSEPAPMSESAYAEPNVPLAPVSPVSPVSPIAPSPDSVEPIKFERGSGGGYRAATNSLPKGALDTPVAAVYPSIDFEREPPHVHWRQFIERFRPSSSAVSRLCMALVAACIGVAAIYLWNNSGDADSLFKKGYAADFGQDVPRNAEVAAQYYEKAARKGSENAQYYLALDYYYGTGVEKNLQEAARWLTKSAEQGDRVAQYMLAQMYEKGEGVEQSLPEALSWYRKAAALGNSNAVEALARLQQPG
jgi:hypothetical protein